MVTPTLGLSVAPHVLRAVAMRGRHVVWAAHAEYENREQMLAAIGRLAAERPRGIRGARLALEGPLAQVRLVETSARLSGTDALAHFQLASRQYFLQNGARLLTCAAIWERDGRARTRSVLLGAAEEPLVEDLVQALATAGLRTTEVAPAQVWLLGGFAGCVKTADAMGDDGPWYLGAIAAAHGRKKAILSLLPRPLREARIRAHRRSTVSWAVACIVSALIAGGSYINAMQRAIRHAEHELTKLSGPMAAAQQVRSDLDQARLAIAFFDEGPGRRRHNARLLAGVARALPDGAFIASLRTERDGRVVMSTLGGRAASVIAALERADGQMRVQLEGAVSREVIAGQEYDRFTAVLTPAGGRP